MALSIMDQGGRKSGRAYFRARCSFFGLEEGNGRGCYDARFHCHSLTGFEDMVRM